MRNNPIGVFDSGIGGLNVLKKCEELMPNEKFIYLADEANMPYGIKSPDEICRLATERADELFSMNCKALVIACNTATVTAIDGIRTLYPDKVIIGLEPAVKPCFRELGRDGYAVALVTSATYGSKKFKRLISACEGKVVPLARAELPKLIEDNIDNIAALRPYMSEIFGDYKDAESVILGCSHYTYLAKIISEFYNGSVKIYDGALGAAERLKYCLAIADLNAPKSEAGSVRFYSTVKKYPSFFALHGMTGV